MNFDLSDEQRMLQEGLERLMSEQYGFDQRHGYLREEGGWSRAMWGRYAEMGLLALPFAECDGGLGGGAVETMVVMEVFGRYLALEPYFATVILCGGLLRHGACDDQRAELVGRIAAGELTLAFAHQEPGSRYRLGHVTTRARQEGDAWVIDGSKRFVLHGGTADQLIVSARIAGHDDAPDGISLFVIDAAAAGVTRRSYVAQDRANMADVELRGVRVPAHACLGEPGQALAVIERAVDDALAALCAEAVGAMDKAHAITVDYLKVRQQFGVAIGGFQALQHRAVDMLVMVEQARSMALYAAMSTDEPQAAQRSTAMSAAKVQINRAARWVGQQGVQLHGGIGATEECQVGHYFRRLSLIEIQFGDTDHHLARLVKSGGLLQDA